MVVGGGGTCLEFKPGPRLSWKTVGTEKGPCSKRGSLGGLGCKHRAQTPGRPPQTRPAPARAAAQARPQSLRVPPGPAPISTQSRPGSEGLSCRNTGANLPTPAPAPAASLAPGSPRPSSARTFSGRHSGASQLC